MLSNDFDKQMMRRFYSQKKRANVEWVGQSLILLLALPQAKWRFSFGLQEKVSFGRLGASIAHRNLLANASVDLVRQQRAALFRDKVVLVSLSDGFGKIFPGSRVRAENGETARHQRNNAVGIEIWNTEENQIKLNSINAIGHVWPASPIASGLPSPPASEWITSAIFRMDKVSSSGRKQQERKVSWSGQVEVD